MSSIVSRGLAVWLVVGSAVLVAQACASGDESSFQGDYSGTGGTVGVDSGIDVASSGGSGGSSATGGASGSGGSGGGGTCQDAFCPNTGSGQACCVTPYGPCGTDVGQGCQENQTGDF